MQTIQFKIQQMGCTSCTNSSYSGQYPNNINGFIVQNPTPAQSLAGTNNLGNNLTTIDQIVRYQTKRLGKPYGSFTAEQLGIRNIINKGNNLYNFISSGRLKLLSCEANGMNEVRIRIQNPSDQILAQILGGTLLIPESRTANCQTLISRSKQQLRISNGCSNHAIPTFCHDKERDIPSEKFVLANIQNINYKEGMTQDQVWQITFQNGKCKPIQQWANKENLILLHKAQLINMIQKW